MIRLSRCLTVGSLAPRGLTMTDAERNAIREALAARVSQAINHPDKAKARLVKEGFYTEAGKLTPQYGGRKSSAR